MTTGTTLNNSGAMSALANGAVPLCVFIKPSGVNAAGAQQVAVAATAKAASVSDVDRVIGVSTPDRDNATTETVTYYSQPGSRVLVKAGAAIAADKDLMVDGTGRAIEATYTAGQTTQLVGRSCEAAALADDLVGIIFFPQLVSVGTAGDDLVVADDLTVGGDVIVSGRVLEKQGADVVAINDLVLGGDGNCFEITGATQINHIDSTGWQNGALITLLFAGAPTVDHANATAGANITILLATAADFVASAGDTLTLRLCEIGGVQAWREVGRAVI
jgi:hypothetical protein